jgi:hypothetical protein
MKVKTQITVDLYGDERFTVPGAIYPLTVTRVVYVDGDPDVLLVGWNRFSPQVQMAGEMDALPYSVLEILVRKSPSIDQLLADWQAR